ncbi:MAG TPA: LysR family transcriptional regulator [Gammaproteobacteria bacterium]|nr:LysR family transcriptional regulator [Gammaproteobacteria bacterium]
MARKRPTLKQLRSFCAAASSGSISRAAEQLGLSQPSVSLQIQALERSLDVILFERRGPKILLTPQGEVFREMTQPLIDNINSLAENFSAHFGELDRGEINIAAGESTILYILPEPVKNFSANFPKVRLKLHNVTGRDGMEMLRTNAADFAVGSMIEVPDDIHYQPIFTYDPVLITPLDHPLAAKEEITLADISPYGLILPPHHLSTWHMVDLVFQQANLPYQVTLEAGGWEVIKKYVANGLGISIVTSICLTGDEGLAQKPLQQFFPRRSYGVVMRRGKFLTPQARKFIDLMDPDFFTSVRHGL